MNNMTKSAAGLIACIILAGCGGGGSAGSNDAPAFGVTVPNPLIEFFPLKPSLLSNRSGFPIDLNSPYFAQLNVKISNGNGAIAPPLTIVDLRVIDLNIASIGLPGFTGRFVSACNGTASGIATYFIQSGVNAGTAQFVASVAAPLTSGTVSVADGSCRTSLPEGFRTISKTLDYPILVGPAPFVRLEAVAGRTTLPVNTFDVPATPGSSFLTPVEVTQRFATGVLATAGTIVATVARPDIIQLSPADDPLTLDNPLTSVIENYELDQKAARVEIDVVAGKVLFYVHSKQRPGTAVVKITGKECPDCVPFSIDLNVTVSSTVAGIAQVIITSDTRAVYVANSSANTVLPLQARAVDDAGEGAPDPTIGVNNVLLEIVNPSGETLVATAASGAGVEGTSIRTRTTQSIASAVFRSAARQGLVQIRATTDRFDNNVDNGIQTPISATKGVTVSDGKLFDIKLTGSVQEVLIERRFITTEFPGTTPGSGAQNGTYGVVIGASATDRQGNPVLPGTAIEFGMVDAPTVGYPSEGPGLFEIAGLDGDPLEGGQRFTAPSGSFTTAGGGAGPNDTLILFGEESNPIRDLESARKVARINGPGSLDIISSTRFNLNDDTTTGIAVDRGPVVPYVIGRATIGNVTNSALTNQFGAVNTTINYPVSRIGHVFVLWARGIGDTPVGQTTAELVTDADAGVFPAAADAKMTVGPNSITAGTGSLVQICLRDGFDNPIPAVFVRYGFSKAIGTVDGATNGVVRSATGLSGCTVALVRATLTENSDGTIIFSAIGLSQNVTITKGGASAQLFAIPGTLGGNGGSVTLRLVDGTGAPIPNVQIAGKCDDKAGLSVPPGATNAQGETSATISANLNAAGTAGTAKCEFSAFGSIAIVTLNGVDICTQGFSPPPVGCTVPTPVVLPSTTLTVLLQRATGLPYVAATGPQVQVIGNAGGVNCVSTAPTNGVCPSLSPIPNGTVVALTASTGINGLPNAASFCRWTGAPGCFGSQPTVQVTMTGNLTCVAVFSETGPAGCPTF